MPRIVTALVGASLAQIWRPPPGVTVGSGADKYAPFQLGTRGLTDHATYGTSQFVRVSAGNVPNVNGTTPIGVTNGVTATAGTGNNWYNVTGLTPVEGDYMFLVSTGVTT